MFDSLEETFLRHLDAIYEKYKEADKEDDVGIDLTLLKRPRRMKIHLEPKKPQFVYPRLFSFLKKRRAGDRTIERFKFDSFREGFGRLYSIYHKEPPFEDLCWVSDVLLGE